MLSNELAGGGVAPSEASPTQFLDVVNEQGETSQTGQDLPARMGCKSHIVKIL